MALTLSVVTIDYRDRILSVPSRQVWWATCGILGTTTLLGRLISPSCSFSGDGQLPMLQSGRRVGRVMLAGVLDDIPTDPEQPTVRQIVMAGIVDRGDTQRVIAGRYPQIEPKTESIIEPLPGGGEQYTAIEFAALLASTTQDAAELEFHSGLPVWLHQ